jgi:glycosyltransferase involved in cell wall biosynthesis
VLAALAQADQVNQYFVFRNSETGPDLTPSAANFNDCPQPVRGTSRPARILYEQLALPWTCARLHLDVLFNGGFTAPFLCTCPMVTVFHDLQYKRHPEYFRWIDLPFWRIMLPLSAMRSRRIVVLSQAVKSDVAHFYRYRPSRISVIPHGIEPEFARIAERRALEPPSSKIILSVSTLHPHKNLDALLAGFKRFEQQNPGWSLWLVGLKGFDTEKIEALRKDLRLQASVTITGWIAREQLYELFASAAAFIYPSRFEGFGIPVLEALAAGIPTACSRLPSLEEIAEGAARFFKPGQIEDMVAALTEITSDEALRVRLRAAGMLRARDFSWERSAASLVSMFQELAQPDRLSKKSQD